MVITELLARAFGSRFESLAFVSGHTSAQNTEMSTYRPNAFVALRVGIARLALVSEML